MQDRVSRLESLLGENLFDSVLWGHEYDMSMFNEELKIKISSGAFRRIVFYGMGCSSVVSDVMKGFFKSEKIPIKVDVVNDYDTEWFIDDSVLQSDGTLSVIVCYSGWSVEPCLFYDKMMRINKCRNLMVLSGGGKIADLCLRDSVSCVKYKMRHADREYPLYHVQQFFSIFLDLFNELGIFPKGYDLELERTVSYLKESFNPETLSAAKDLADRMRDSTIVFLTTPKWYGTLLKQVTMFFNEIAMVPAHRNLLHEWSHTEVAAFSNPIHKLSIMTFSDVDDDQYSLEKIDILKGLFGDKSIVQNRNIEFFDLRLDQNSFMEKYLFANFFAIQVAYHLAIYTDTEGRDLISKAAGNPWWNQKNIEAHPDCRDIPGSLNTEDVGFTKTSKEFSKALSI